MNELKIFENEAFGQIRSLEIENEPWLVGKEGFKVVCVPKT